MIIIQLALGMILGGVLLLMLPLLLPFAFLIGVAGLILCVLFFALSFGLVMFAGTGLVMLPLAAIFLCYIVLSRGCTGWLDFFFNPNGRVGRLEYIAVVAASWLICALAFRHLPEFYAVCLGLFLAFPTTCVGIRRWHDFNFRGWWLLLRFAPLAMLFFIGPFPIIFLLAQFGPLAVLAVEALVPGTRGANRFGPVPGNVTAKATPVPSVLVVSKLGRAKPAAKPAVKVTAKASRPAPKAAKKPARKNKK